MCTDDKDLLTPNDSDLKAKEFEDMDISELLDVLEDREFDISLKLNIAFHPTDDQKIQVDLIKDGKEQIFHAEYNHSRAFPKNGFSALIILPNGPVIISALHYSLMIKKLFGIIRNYEGQGWVVKCLNLGLLGVNFYKIHDYVRTDIRELKMNQINYHTMDESFEGIRRFVFQLQGKVNS